MLVSLRVKGISRMSQMSRCRVEHEKRNFISTSSHVLFCFSYKHNSPLLIGKVHFILIKSTFLVSKEK